MGDEHSGFLTVRELLLIVTAVAGLVFIMLALGTYETDVNTPKVERPTRNGG